MMMNRLQSQPSTSGSVRLQKAMADAGVAARRDCEQLILTGRVRVNGLAVSALPCFIDPARDRVELDGVALTLPDAANSNRTTVSKSHVYLLINKPKGVITTTRDPEGRPSVLDLVPHALRSEERLFPVGRLDADSTGLLLITNDGDLAFQLTHPKFGLAKEYRVTCRGLATEEQLETLRRGLFLVTPAADGSKTSKHASMESVRIIKRLVDRARGDRTLLSVTLREGQNREIRRLLARVGLKVKELERVAIGPLRLTGLQPGASKLLGKRDIEKLRAAALAPMPRSRPSIRS